MATGIYPLRKIQIGPELTAGVAVPATAVWRGIAVRPKNDNLHVMPKENVGILSATARSYTPRKLATIDFPQVEATPEQLPFILDSAIVKAVPAADGIGTGYVRTYATPVKLSNNPSVTDLVTRTIEGGDNALVEEIAYAFVTEFELSGKAEEAWKVSAKWTGRESSSSAFTAALTPATVSEFMFGNTRLYIDLPSGTIGSTEIAATLIEASFKQTTGWRPRFTASGDITFSGIEFTEPKATLDLTLLLNTTSIAQKTNWNNDTPVCVRLKAEGKALATAGTYTKKTMIIDSAGILMGFDDADGNNNGAYTVKVTLECAYDFTEDLFTKIVIVNETAVMG